MSTAVESEGQLARITFSLPVEHRRELEVWSRERDLTVAQLVRRAVREMLAEKPENGHA